MEKRTLLKGSALPWLLLAPQLLVTLIFFYWPAAQAIQQSFFVEDAFGTTRNFVGLDNYRDLFSQPEYFRAMGVTLLFSICVGLLSLGLALALAMAADRNIRGAALYKTLLIWPYAVAPAVAGALWLFMFQPSLGLLTHRLNQLGLAWNPLLNGNDAMILVILAATWKQISYNFLFFLAGLQAIPKSLIEAAAVDAAGPWRRFWTIILPLLSPTTFFLLIINIVYVFFDTFGIVDAITHGGPAAATTTLVFKVYSDGRLGGDLGGSAAQSVILMFLVIALTAFQFKFVERKVNY